MTFLPLRREPYRLFFPLALVIGWAGMFPWFAFGQGWVRDWPGFPHALTMTQGFLLSLVVGFLGTMIPRRAQAAPMPSALLAGLVLAVVAVPVASWARSVVVAEMAYAAALVMLGVFAVRSFKSRAERRPPPPSFVLLPIGFLLGITGAVLIAAHISGHAEPWALSLGRQLVQQGLMLALIMAIVPMVGPILASGEAPADPARGRMARLRAAHLGAGATLAASFLVEEWVSIRAGLSLRAAVVAVELVVAGRLLAPLAVPGLHRRCFKVALWMLLLGLVAAATAPATRVASLHLAFVGGFSLLALAVSVHVTLVHGGREREARGRPALVAVAAGLTLAAAVLRYGAERLPQHFFPALMWGSALWLAAALAWGVYLGTRSGSSSRNS